MDGVGEGFVVKVPVCKGIEPFGNLIPFLPGEFCVLIFLAQGKVFLGCGGDGSVASVSKVCNFDRYSPIPDIAMPLGPQNY